MLPWGSNVSETGDTIKAKSGEIVHILQSDNPALSLGIEANAATV